ncbi:hypothetical protein [Sanguibacter antarcticus]|uniref:hypothetical protein n=1 Tax=Sanguibacter antarcticus TaxID=372484 RepID=UPI001FE7B835|nr:hypothetical protein [Sanguibacter antarcticus]
MRITTTPAITTMSRHDHEAAIFTLVGTPTCSTAAGLESAWADAVSLSLLTRTLFPAPSTGEPSLAGLSPGALRF